MKVVQNVVYEVETGLSLVRMFTFIHIHRRISCVYRRL